MSSVFLSRTVYIIFFALTTKKVFSEIRTIRIFHHFTDKSALNVKIRPHYYTVFLAFPQQILSGKRFFELLSSNFLSSFPNIYQIRESQKSGFREPHMTKVTYFSTVLNGKTGYRRIRLKLRTAQICASSMPGTAGFHITGSPPDICLHLCSFRTSILILKDEQISINA